jgi:hypothetical protein
MLCAGPQGSSSSPLHCSLSGNAITIYRSALQVLQNILANGNGVVWQGQIAESLKGKQTSCCDRKPKSRMFISVLCFLNLVLPWNL